VWEKIPEPYPEEASGFPFRVKPVRSPGSGLQGLLPK
jgi:hypothetical protein